MERSSGRRDAVEDAESIRIIEEAAAWFAKSQGAHPSKNERRALQAWLASDPRHQEAFANVGRLWEGAIELPALAEHRASTQKGLTRRGVAKAALAGAIGIGAWRYWADYPFADYRTAKGERRTISLPDGSTVDLAAETALSVAHSPERRLVRLHQGEAFFTVAPQSGRPFVVEAGEGRSTALGTAFGVTYRSDTGKVIVTEHSVEVALSKEALRIDAGSQLSYDGTHLGVPEPSDDDSELAWRQGRLVFAQTTLGDAVTALNRWRSGRIVVMSPALAARPITLIVHLDRTERIVSQLADALPIRTVSVTPFLTLLFPA